MSFSIGSSPSAATTTWRGATRNPSSSAKSWIMRSRKADVLAPRQQPFLDRLDLQRQIFRVDAALGEAPGDEPEARLRRAGVHVAQFLSVAESPDRADALGDRITEQSPHQIFLWLVAGRQHDQVGGERLAAFHPRAPGDKCLDIRKLLQRNLAARDQVGAADVEIIAAA